MKKRIKLAALALPLIGLGLAGCGGSEDQVYSDALPSSDSMAMQLDGLEVAGGQALTEGITAETLPTNDACHPHLFQRTSEVVHILNGIINPLMKRVDASIEKGPHEKTGQTRRWLRSLGKENLRVTVTHTSGTSYTFQVDVKALGAADGTYTTVLSGTLTPDAQVPHAGSGTVHMDLTALSKVNPDEKATGSVDVAYQVAGATKTMDITVKAYEPNDTRIVRPPRDAHYVYTREAGVGGTVKLEENVVLYCPSNPDRKVADVKTVARWLHRPDNTVVGRSDAMATGGQIAQGDRWMGITCSTRGANDTAGAERYWQMKLEGPDGNTLRGDSTYAAADANDPTTSCDAAFGVVPSLDTSSGDYDFSKVDFTDSTPVALPTTP